MAEIKVNIPEEFTVAISEVLGTDRWILTKDNYGGKYGPSTKFMFTGWVKNRYSTDFYQTQLASWQMVQFPGCCGICISYFSYINYGPEYKSLELLLNKVSIWMAKSWGYNTLMYAAVDGSSIATTLKQNGWKDIHNLVGPISRRGLTVSVVDLTTVSLSD